MTKNHKQCKLMTGLGNTGLKRNILTQKIGKSGYLPKAVPVIGFPKQNNFV